MKVRLQFEYLAGMPNNSKRSARVYHGGHYLLSGYGSTWEEAEHDAITAVKSLNEQTTPPDKEVEI